MAKQSTKLPSGQATLYNFLLNEILASQLSSSDTFLIVAPWVTNFPLNNPYYVSFQEIVETRQETLHLFDILHQIATNGTNIKITVGKDSRYHSPLKQLSQQNIRIQTKVLSELHAKAYVGNYGAIEGSLNLTGNGVHQNLELFTYSYDEANRSKLRKFCLDCFEKGEPL